MEICWDRKWSTIKNWYCYRILGRKC